MTGLVHSKIDSLEGARLVCDDRVFGFVLPDDGNDVETAAMLKQLVFLQPGKSRLCEVSSFLRVDSLTGCSRAAGFDLDENDGVSVQADEVDFSPTSFILPRQNSHAGFLEELRGDFFATVSESASDESKHGGSAE
jgi:hypothetical protein